MFVIKSQFSHLKGLTMSTSLNLMPVTRAVFGVLLTAKLAAAAVVFQDGDFQDADWTSVKALDTTTSNSGEFTRQRVASGGNPGAYQQTDFDWFYHSTTSRSQGMVVASSLNMAIYTPSTQGSVASIDFHIDGSFLGQTGGLSGVFTRLLAIQDGRYFLATEIYINKAAWTPTDQILTQADFVAIDNGGQPDFVSGGPINFGYTVSGAGNVGGSRRLGLDVGIDNFSATINSVPEPAVGLLAIVPLAILARGRDQ